MNGFGIFTAPMVKELMYHTVRSPHFDPTFTEKAKSLTQPFLLDFGFSNSD